MGELERNGGKRQRGREDSEASNYLCHLSVSRYWLIETSHVKIVLQPFCPTC